MSKRKLTDADLKHLANYECKLQLVKDQTTLCARGYWSSLYVHGSGGIGKSFAVLSQLDAMGIKPVLHNTRLSGPAFFNSIEQHSKELHVIEDVEQVFLEHTNMSLVRLCLVGSEGQDGQTTTTRHLRRSPCRAHRGL